MSNNSPDDLILRMYRANVSLADSLAHLARIKEYDKRIDSSLSNANHCLRAVDGEIRNINVKDPGRFEGYVKGINGVQAYLRVMDKTPETDEVYKISEEAEAAGLDALRFFMAYEPPANYIDENFDERNVQAIVQELEMAITGSNELSVEQKKDALGYVGALNAILAMQHPDKKAFDVISDRLKQYGNTLGNVAILELTKELIKWGFQNLL